MRFALLTGAAIGAIIGLTIEALDSSRPVVHAANPETYRQLNLFGEIFDRVKESYVSETADQELIEAAINGMLTELDPHSAYLDAKSFEDMRVNTKGEFGGLGIEVGMENGFVKVIAPIDDTPAARAGIQSGDLITKLDDEEVLGLTLSDAVDRMRGKVGTDIVITVKREGVAKPFEITITRDVIQIRPVRSRAEDDVAYLRITSFNENTFDDLEKAIASLKQEIGAEKVTGYVLDLRNNPGGLLNQAVMVSDAFLNRGEIVSTKGRSEESEIRFSAENGDLTEGKPIVVLVNGGSASASEIVAGALQDHGRALVLGTKSFGKGSVQTIIPIGREGALKLTTALYYTPEGRSIQASGIIPDVEVPQGRFEAAEGQTGGAEASLPGRIENPEGQDGQGNDEEVSADNDAVPEDYQLQYALNLLRGLAKLQ